MEIAQLGSSVSGTRQLRRLGRTTIALQNPSVTIPIFDLARTGRREGSRSNNHNRDDASAGCARIEVGTDDLLHWELAALIATKPNRGRDARLEEGDKGDLHRRPVFTSDRAELYNADRTTDG